MFLRLFLPLLVPTWLLSACGSCSADSPAHSSTSPETPPSKLPGGLADSLYFTVGDARSPPPEEPYEPTAQDYLDMGIPLTMTDPFGPFDGRIFLAAGKVDFANHHTSTVMISTDGPFGAAICSGILLTPSLVLTAASCVCSPQKVTSPEGRTTTLFDSSACAPSIHATAFVFGKAVNEYIAEMEMMPSSLGAVRPHPDFKLLLDEHQAVVASHADLAVLVLNKPIPGKIRPASLSNQEVHAQEVLTMVGFGYGRELGQIFGLRFIRRDKVLGEAPGGGRFLYEQQGAFLYNGFIGGPCFQENHGRYVLAGIASIGTAQELSFTSTYAYRDWLGSEIRRSRARGAH